ncbi:hypothetical protein TNCV_888971 [Trichonephila clavipes]|nr:hypothetical protein TNCV_888971 [Trichonephila clavipes]
MIADETEHSAPHDNAPSYTACHLVEYLAQHNVATLPHPSLEPRLDTAKLFSVPKNKINAQGEALRIVRGGSTGCAE